MDRRIFLKWIPKSMGAVIAATVIPVPKAEALPSTKILTLGGEQDCIDLAHEAAICFGLRLTGVPFNPVRHPFEMGPNLEIAENISNYYNSDEDLDEKLRPS